MKKKHYKITYCYHSYSNYPSNMHWWSKDLCMYCYSVDAFDIGDALECFYASRNPSEHTPALVLNIEEE